MLNDMVNWKVVKNQRIKLDLTQKDMAEKLGLTNQNVYSIYERDKVTKIDEEMVEKIAVILGVPMEKILKVDDEFTLSGYNQEEKKFIASDQGKEVIKKYINNPNILENYSNDEMDYIISPEGQQSIKKFIYDHQVYQAGLKYLETLKKK